MESSKDISLCHPYLQQKWPLVLDLYKKIMRKDLFITCAYRSVEEQARLYAQGRSTPGDIVTKIDGVTKMGLHNFTTQDGNPCALALDVCVSRIPIEIKIMPTWDEELYYPLGYIAEQVGLIWGGDWKDFSGKSHNDSLPHGDLPHLQVPFRIEEPSRASGFALPEAM